MSKEIKDYTRLEQFLADLRDEYKENKSFFISGFIFNMLLGIIISSSVTMWWKTTIHELHNYYVIGFVTEAFSNPVSIIFMLALSGVLFERTYHFKKLNEKDYITIKEEDGETWYLAKEHPYGDAHWMDKTEAKELCVIDNDFWKIKEDIFGMDKAGAIYGKRMDLISINNNAIAFGASRSGKSASIVINDVLQCIKRGESMVVTDTKGDLYRDTAYIAKKNGYIVKILNVKPRELKNSDGWNPLKYVTAEDDIQADVLAKACIENTHDKIDYWAENDLNCLKAAILLVATSKQYEGRRTFKEVIDIVTNPSNFEPAFANLDPDSPAKACYDIYASANERERGQILNGLSVHLNILQNKYVKEIMSNDEIDLILPMKKKCIYYIVISDTETTMSFVSSMFFTQIFMMQCQYFDELSREEQKKQLKVKYILDEFKNLGRIPFFDVRIATFASRGIYTTIILQDTKQLEELYPRGSHETILANCSTKILLHAGDLDTAKYFSMLCGETTKKVFNEKYGRFRTLKLDYHDGQDISTGLAKGMLLNPDKAIKWDKDIILICVTGFQPLKLKKYITSIYNPMYQEQYKELQCKNHIPKWRKRKIEETEALEDKLRILERKASGKTLTMVNGDVIDTDTGEVIEQNKETNSDTDNMNDVIVTKNNETVIHTTDSKENVRKALASHEEERIRRAENREKRYKEKLEAEGKLDENKYISTKGDTLFAQMLNASKEK